jgi:hypothetical protein
VRLAAYKAVGRQKCIPGSDHVQSGKKSSADHQWKDKSEDALPSGGAFLVIVAQNGADDRPDPKTIQAFVMQGSMGLSYAPGIWRMSFLPSSYLTFHLPNLSPTVTEGYKGGKVLMHRSPGPGPRRHSRPRLHRDANLDRCQGRPRRKGLRVDRVER